MNVAADLGLLEPIPHGAPIRPHRFRRTFAVTARKYPWMQIALNWQCKHASHFMTQSYYALNDDVTAEDNEVAMELVEAAVDRLAELYQQHERGEPLYGKAAHRLVGELDAIAVDVATVEPGAFEGQTWRHAEVRKPPAGVGPPPLPRSRPRLRLRPRRSLWRVEAPNWNACNPRCGNTILDPAQLAFLKDAADRIRSYLDDGRIGTTTRLLLQDQLDELTIAIAESGSSPAARTSYFSRDGFPAQSPQARRRHGSHCRRQRYAARRQVHLEERRRDRRGQQGNRRPGRRPA